MQSHGSGAVGPDANRHAPHRRTPNCHATQHERREGDSSQRGQQPSREAPYRADAERETPNRQAAAGNAADCHHAVSPIPHRQNRLGVPMAFSPLGVGAAGYFPQWQPPQLAGRPPAHSAPLASPGESCGPPRLPITQSLCPSRGQPLPTLGDPLPSPNRPQPLGDALRTRTLGSRCLGWRWIARRGTASRPASTAPAGMHLLPQVGQLRFELGLATLEFSHAVRHGVGPEGP